MPDGIGAQSGGTTRRVGIEPAEVLVTRVPDPAALDAIEEPLFPVIGHDQVERLVQSEDHPHRGRKIAFGENDSRVLQPAAFGSRKH
jgi:hypothetical protein